MLKNDKLLNDPGDQSFVFAKDLFPVIEQLLAEGKQAVFTVTGMSMWPFICHGRDQAVIESCNPRDLQKGDIVLVKRAPGSYMLHRITKLTDTALETTGDGCLHSDGEFPLDSVVAKCVVVIRKGKMYPCDKVIFKWYSKVWMLLYPLRKKVVKMIIFISEIKRIKHNNE